MTHEKTETTNLRKEAQAILDSLNYDFYSFDLASFTSWIEETTGKAVHFIPADCSKFDATGFWVVDDENHYICYQPGLPPWHEDHTKTHELCHVAAGHTTLPIGDQGVEIFIKCLGQQTCEGMQLRASLFGANPTNDDIAEAMACLIYERSARSIAAKRFVGSTTVERTETDYLRKMRLIE
jgi:hypothetical protein